MNGLKLRTGEVPCLCEEGGILRWGGLNEHAAGDDGEVARVVPGFECHLTKAVRAGFFRSHASVLAQMHSLCQYKVVTMNIKLWQKPPEGAAQEV
jgi:hypothetical protein